jgi:hypothetical protein
MRQSKAVYRRRRLAVLLLVLVIIALVWWAVSAVRGGGASPSPSRAAASASTSPLACPTGALSVTAAVQKSQFSVSEHPGLIMRVKNISSTDCTANVGTSQQQFVVGSGDQNLWYSKPCITNAADQTRVIKAGQTLSGSVAWDGTTNTIEACAKSTAASGKPGTYWVTASLGDAVSPKVSFVLQ